VVSIFVNPTQFGPNEDLAAYPRDLERDLSMLEAGGTDVVWTPTQEVMYPQGYQTWVSVEEVSKPLEGSMRPGHFRGVATVVTKLFNAVQPDKAYFGQKDAQQLAVILRMVNDLNFPIEIIACPTVREPDGLAMSSRNVYLNTEERSSATVLFRALMSAKGMFMAGERDAATLRQVMMDVLDRESNIRVQYISVANPETLDELEGEIDRALCSLAVYVGKTRLIDNMMLD
jgi:pantoate--beta-alanine ligase